MGQNNTKKCCKNIKIYPQKIDTNLNNQSQTQNQNNSEIIHEEIFQNYKNIEYDHRRGSSNIVIINGKTYVKDDFNCINNPNLNNINIQDPAHDIFYDLSVQKIN
jgi:hypothetical protein